MDTQGKGTVFKRGQSSAHAGALSYGSVKPQSIMMVVVLPAEHRQPSFDQWPTEIEGPEHMAVFQSS